jgi:hypothetical protein
MSEWGHDVVLMPVPLRWAQEVASYLTELREGRSHSNPLDEATETTVSVPGQGA